MSDHANLWMVPHPDSPAPGMTTPEFCYETTGDGRPWLASIDERVRDAAEKGRALYGPNPTSGDTAEGLLRAMTAHWDRERAVMANLSDVAGAISTSERLGREYGELMKRVYTYLERSALEPQDAA